MLTQERLKELLHYNPETGIFTWLVSRGNAAAGTVAGSISKHHGYVIIGVDGVTYRAHRMAVLYMKGRFPIDQVDHENGIRHDNRWRNLTQTDNATNHRNLGKKVNNKSGVTGVSWSRKSNKWYACIQVGYKSKNLGHYSDFDDAVKARREAERKYGFHNNHGLRPTYRGVAS